MSELAELIDNLPPPVIPSSLSQADQQLIQLLIDSARQQVRPFTGKYEAPWLLVPFEADVWETTNRGREEMIESKWKNTVRIDWRVQLPNGQRLTNAHYEKLLTAAKKISFLARSDLIYGNSAPTSWGAGTFWLLALLRWLVLHEKRFEPEVYALRLIDQAALDWLLGEYAQGGWTQAMQIPQRLLAAFYRGAHGTICSQSLLDAPYELLSDEIQPLVRWIESQDGYTKAMVGVHREKRHLSRRWLSQLINESVETLRSHNTARFCRQFEPDLATTSHLDSLRRRTEFPSHRVKSLDDERDASTENSVRGIGHLFRSVLDAHRHLPDLLPEPKSLSIRRSLNLANRFARPKGHTPLLPVNTGLTYLNSSIRFVHVYGEAIIGLYLAVLRSIVGNESRRAKWFNNVLKQHAKNWCIASGEPITNILNITEFRRERESRDFNRFRSNPTLDEALRVLIGSCVVSMAILKPSREDELVHAKRSCLRDDDNGYWFNYNLGKSNIKGAEAWLEQDRPVPVITTKAIKLLQRLGDGLAQILAADSKASDNLFYLPKIEGLGALTANDGLLNIHLDYFCDFVNLPPNSDGGRWYVRIHEMRKWFLLLLFWSGRFDVLDAARWIAGHTDASHIYAYIEMEFPGESLPQIEAEYSEERLRRLESGDSGNDEGVNALYESVLKHFNVDSLTMIPESEWTAYVLALRESDAFHLEPHSIRDEDSVVVGINVSFVMRQVA